MIDREKERLRAAEYRKRNPEKARESVRKYRDKHREELIVKNRPMYRDRALKKSYGIGVKEYSAMLIAQSGRCKICGSLPYEKNLCVDHCHNTGRIRGLLCSKCNMVLGLVGDRASVLRSAVGYLETTK